MKCTFHSNLGGYKLYDKIRKLSVLLTAYLQFIERVLLSIMHRSDHKFDTTSEGFGTGDW